MYAILLGALAVAPPEPQSCDDPAGCPLWTADADDGAPEPHAAPLPAYDLALSHGRQAQDPYGSVDFSAYTLEQGEVRLGLNGAAVGLTPRLQLGTTPSLDAIGVANVYAKADAVRSGKMDIAFAGTAVNTSSADLDALYLRATMVASRQLVGGWSLHEEISYAWLRGAGVPDATPFAPALSGLASWTPTAGTSGESFVGTGKYLGARLATDYRFNRRDSVVLQAQSLIWGQSDMPVNIPASASAGGPTAGQVNGLAAPTDAYTVSLGYQARLRNVDVRVGIGTSSVPGAWLLQTVDVGYRFGGHTDRAEHAALAAIRAADVESTATNTPAATAPVASWDSTR